MAAVLDRDVVALESVVILAVRAVALEMAAAMADNPIQCALHLVISAAIVCSANVRLLIQVAVAVETVVVQVITRMAVVVADGVAHARTS